MDVRDEGEKLGLVIGGVGVVLLFIEIRNGGRIDFGRKMSLFWGMLSVKYL